MDNPVGWLYRVAFNLAHSHFRRARAERKALQAAEDAGRQLPPVDLVGRYEIRAALESLPRRQRRAVVLRHYIGLSVQEVAEAMECSDRTVKRLTSEALEALRRQLDPGVKTLEVSR
jgi:RNA polymerase sigma factor (sigma-70 family)